MTWHYQARKRTDEDGNTFYDLVEAFGDGTHTADPVSFQADSKAELAEWLRKAADDVEKYDAIS